MDRLPLKRRRAIPVQLTGRYPPAYWDEDGGVFTQVPTRKDWGPSANKVVKGGKVEAESGYYVLSYSNICVSIFW
jgi:hypothetical protein